MSVLELSPLGQKSAYKDTYDSALLFPIPRVKNRSIMGIDDKNLPFKGHDVWHAYELSFLNIKGKPVVAIAEVKIPCESPNLIESKSFKLYLNSFNNSQFYSLKSVEKKLVEDLSQAAGAAVSVCLSDVDDVTAPNCTLGKLPGICIDVLDVACDVYHVSPELLKHRSDEVVSETLYSNLLKSNCLVTSQPDWGSVVIEYEGKAICHESLLQYIVSFRNHNEFHEPCVEHIFSDIMRILKPTKLTVEAKYTRRGGLDICPFRSTENTHSDLTMRLVRQ